MSEEEADAGDLVKFMGGVWEILRVVPSEDDLHPQEVVVSYNLRHRFGPVDLTRCVYIEGVSEEEFEVISEMEALAIAALD